MKTSKPSACDNDTVKKKINTNNSKTTKAFDYVNKPIFRRKLIEKYSTARYNFNTKLVLTGKYVNFGKKKKRNIDLTFGETVKSILNNQIHNDEFVLPLDDFVSNNASSAMDVDCTPPEEEPLSSLQIDMEVILPGAEENLQIVPNSIVQSSSVEEVHGDGRINEITFKESGNCGITKISTQCADVVDQIDETSCVESDNCETGGVFARNTDVGERTNENTFVKGGGNGEARASSTSVAFVGERMNENTLVESGDYENEKSSTPITDISERKNENTFEESDNYVTTELSTQIADISDRTNKTEFEGTEACANIGDQINGTKESHDYKSTECKSKNDDIHSKKWKLAPREVYKYLSSRNEQKHRWRIRKRKTARYRKKLTKKFEYMDPYVKCMDDMVENVEKNANFSKYGIIMHLGVNRPLFPLIYRNLKLLNRSKDTEISDFWSEFALSTLVTKTEDKNVKSVLVAVKDPELLTAITECEQLYTSSGSRSINFDKTDDPKVKIKEENSADLHTEFMKQENEPIVKKKRRRRKPVNFRGRSYTLRSVDKKTSNTFSNEYKNELEFENQSVHDSAKSKKSVSFAEIVETKVFGSSSPEKNVVKQSLEEQCVLKKFGYKECMVLIPKLSSETVDVLKNHKYEKSVELQSPSAKLNKNRLPMNSAVDENTASLAAENSNTPARISALSITAVTPVTPTTPVTTIPQVTEVTPVTRVTPVTPVTLVTTVTPTVTLQPTVENEVHFFGQSHCSRTFGTYINYISRNRTIVYYYKIKKMLDFQKSNNKYFKICDYVRINRIDHDDFIDVGNSSAVSKKEECETEQSLPKCDNENNLSSSHSTTSADTENKVKTPLNSSKDPNDILSYYKITDWKDRSVPISLVKPHLLKSASQFKWLSIKLDKTIASLTYADECVLRHRFLFEILYRAELSKKIICSEVEKKEGLKELQFGIYSFPSLCEIIFIGPYFIHEDHKLVGAIRLSNGEIGQAHIRTLEEKENFPDADQVSSFINAKWWWPRKQSNEDDANEQYLKFLFESECAELNQSDKFNLQKLLTDHRCFHYDCYVVTGKENNFVLVHDPARTNETTFTTHYLEQPKNEVEKEDRNKPIVFPTYPRKRRMTEKFISCMLEEADRKLKIKREFRSAQKSAKTFLNKDKNRLSALHIENERMRRLEFRTNKILLASVLKNQPIPSNAPFPDSLVSVLHTAVDFVKSLEKSTSQRAIEADLLRRSQNMMMMKFLKLMKGLDKSHPKFIEGLKFLNLWKKLKYQQRDKLYEILKSDEGVFQNSKRYVKILPKPVPPSEIEETALAVNSVLTGSDTSTLQGPEKLPAKIKNEEVDLPLVADETESPSSSTDQKIISAPSSILNTQDLVELKSRRSRRRRKPTNLFSYCAPGIFVEDEVECISECIENDASDSAFTRNQNWTDLFRKINSYEGKSRRSNGMEQLLEETVDYFGNGTVGPSYSVGRNNSNDLLSIARDEFDDPTYDGGRKFKRRKRGSTTFNRSRKRIQKFAAVRSKYSRVRTKQSYDSNDVSSTCGTVTGKYGKEGDANIIDLSLQEEEIPVKSVISKSNASTENNFILSKPQSSMVCSVQVENNRNSNAGIVRRSSRRVIERDISENRLDENAYETKRKGRSSRKIGKKTLSKTTKIILSEHSYSCPPENSMSVAMPVRMSPVNSNIRCVSKEHQLSSSDKKLIFERLYKNNGNVSVAGPVPNREEENNLEFQTVVQEVSSSHLTIDIIENQQVFARLNIAKANRGEGSEQNKVSEAHLKIVSLMQNIIKKMQLSSNLKNGANDERSIMIKKVKLIKRLKNLVEKFETGKKPYDVMENLELFAADETEENSRKDVYITPDHDLWESEEDSDANRSVSSAVVSIEDIRIRDLENIEIEVSEKDKRDSELLDQLNNSIYECDSFEKSCNNSIEKQGSGEKLKRPLSGIVINPDQPGIETPVVCKNIKIIPLKNGSVLHSPNLLSNTCPILQKSPVRVKIVPSINSIFRSNCDGLTTLQVKSSTSSAKKLVFRNETNEDSLSENVKKPLWYSLAEGGKSETLGEFYEKTKISDESETVNNVEENSKGIGIKSFARVDKFHDSFSSNIDKFLKLD